MSSTMKRGICWAIAALQVTPDTALGSMGDGDAKGNVAVALSDNNNNNNRTNNHHHHHPHPPLHQKSNSSNGHSTGLLAGVVDTVRGLAEAVSPGSGSNKDDAENVVPTYTRDQVSDHCSGDSCWIIVNNRVYDVTRFLRMHPGGEDIILEYGGHDATSAFIDKGHSLDAFDMLGDYCIGEITKAEWFPEKNHT